MTVEFTLTRTTRAPIETVFDSLTNHRAIADYVWAVRRSTLDREGVPAPNGVGAVRRIEAVGPPIVEEIIDYQRPTRYAYKMLSGAPVRDHVGTVELREAGAGTEVSWHLRSTPKIPGLDRLLSLVLKRVIGELLKGAVNAAEGGA
ncbi:MAG TPA: SRPBCC family protein [Mycobacterium sp.]|nr:SRPBCC family protein [Mycobacterium sp.]